MHAAMPIDKQRLVLGDAWVFTSLLSTVQLSVGTLRIQIANTYTGLGTKLQFLHAYSDLVSV